MPKLGSLRKELEPTSIMALFVTFMMGSGVIGSGVIGSGVIGSGVIGSGVMGSGVMGSGVMGSGVIGFGIALSCGAEAAADVDTASCSSKVSEYSFSFS